VLILEYKKGVSILMKKFKFIFIIVIAFILDQVSKILVMNNLKINGSIDVIKNFFRITYSHNDGAAFGMFGGKTIFIVVVSILVLAYLLFELFYHKKRNLLVDISTSLIVGGLLGNLFDRLYFGYVRDFLDFKIFNYDFAIFNLADTFIVVGAVLFLIGVILEERHENSSK